jgi:hypothetical protein
MKTLVTTLAVLTLSFATVIAKEGTFTSVIIPDGDPALQLNLSAHQWIKITNFTQNDASMMTHADPAGVAVYKGTSALWVLFARDVGANVAHEDVFVAGPATVRVMPPEHGGAILFLTYERGSD